MSYEKKMDALSQLLDEANANDSQKEQITALFSEAVEPENIRPVDIQITLDDSLDLSTRTVLFSEEDRAETDVSESKNQENIGQYRDLGLLGKGGMGEVRRILDPKLNRRLAMKIIHPKLIHTRVAIGRFIEEAQIVAQLQHPNIIPIHEIGELEDGRLYFTMKEVKGKSLADLISEVHHAAKDNVWLPTSDGWSFRKLVNIFSQVCAATAYAHSKGVIHRDLKPENILIGQFDQVLLVDWGIAKILGRGEEQTEEWVVPNRSGANQTQMGEVAGTPAYMAPEQARGRIDQIDARTDIYALGAVLYEILSGRSPYGGTTFQQILSKVIMGPPPSVRKTILSIEQQTETIELDFFATEEILEESQQNQLDDHNELGIKLPDELVAACEKAMNRNREGRFQSATELQRVVLDWIEGTHKKEKALRLVHEAMDTNLQKENIETKRKQLFLKIAQMKAEAPLTTDERELSSIWALEDQCEQLLLEQNTKKTQRELLLKSALTHKPDLEEAHIELILDYKKEHQVAERTQNSEDLEKAKIGIETHLQFLSKENTVYRETKEYLKGTGSLSLDTTPTEAEVWISPFQKENRRLQPLVPEFLGTTPLKNIPIEMGSYLLRIRKKGHHEVRYPIRIDRQSHWSGVAPDQTRPPIWLPSEGTLAQDECYIPAGPFLCGRCKKSQNPLPDTELWIDGFIASRYHVTYEQYLEYVQDLQNNGKIEECSAAIPYERAQGASSSGTSSVQLNAQGVFVLQNDPKGFLPNRTWPVAYVNFKQAVAYTKWLAQKTGKEWRLINEFEWEKAARGVDARTYPWGNFFSPAWCSMDLSKEEKCPTAVDAFPVDSSVYGVRGCGGGIAEWTSSPWQAVVDLPKYSRVEIQPAYPCETKERTWRGGAWNFPDLMSCSANRVAFHEEEGTGQVGFRVVRSIQERK